MKARPKTAVRPVTGKKGGGTKKKKTNPLTFNFPLINIEELKKVPMLTIEIRIASLKADGSPLIDIQVPIDTTLIKIIQIINEKHNNALKNIKLFLGKEDASNKTYNNLNFRGNLYAFLFKTFKEIPFQDNKKIVGGEILKIYYDFEACQHPLLEANFNI